MANEKHLEILKLGVETWNKWKIECEETTRDLHKVNFSGANFSGIDLTGVNLSGAILTEINLSDTNLTKADLHKADLSGADLSGANLFKANLFKADLTEANLAGADFFDANLSHAELMGADLSGSSMIGASLHETNMIGVDLTGADLTGAYLIGTNLGSADLSKTNLTGADLSGADLTLSILYKTNFNGTQFVHTTFGLTNLSKCIGLENVEVNGECIIDFQTLNASKNVPKSFLLKIGLPELYIDYLPDFFTDTLTLFPAFLSHSKENREFARKLYEALIAKGVNVFFDEKKLKPGDSLVKTITKGIHHYDKTILVCSKESLASKWVDYELELVLKKELAFIEQKGSDDVGLLIPITIDDHIFSWKGPKEWDIKNRFIGDFREWKDGAKFERALNELIHALNIKRPDIKPPSFL